MNNRIYKKTSDIEGVYSKYYLKWHKNQIFKKEDFNVLVQLEVDFRNITFKLLTEYENQIKKDIIIFLDKVGISRLFWLDKDNFTKKYTNDKNSKKSKYKMFIDKALQIYKNNKKLNLKSNFNKASLTQKITKLKEITKDDLDIDVLFYYMSLGTFFDLLKGMKPNIFKEFCNSKIKTSNNRYEDHSFFKMTNLIRFMRNRCAHSNQVLSTYAFIESNNNLHIHLSEVKYNKISGNLLKVILFIMESLNRESKKYYKKKYVKFLRKNKKLIDKYSKDLNLEIDAYKIVKRM